MKTKIDALFAMAISRSPRYAELAESRGRAHGARYSMKKRTAVHCIRTSTRTLKTVQTQFWLNLKAKIEQFARGLDTQRKFSWMFLWTLMFVGQLIGENVILYA